MFLFWFFWMKTFHCPLAFSASNKGCVVIVSLFLLTYCISWLWLVLRFSLYHWFEGIFLYGVFPLMLLLVFELLELWVHSVMKLKKRAITFSETFSSSKGSSYVYMKVLKVVPKFIDVLLLFSLFSLCDSLWFSCFVLSSLSTPFIVHSVFLSQMLHFHL
jgi:hypothetical protein